MINVQAEKDSDCVTVHPLAEFFLSYFIPIRLNKSNQINVLQFPSVLIYTFALLHWFFDYSEMYVFMYLDQLFEHCG